MKRIFILFIILMLLLPVAVRGEEQGLLPSLADAFGVSMPSLGDVLHRYPDSETKESDGSIVQHWIEISDKEFEAFSEYLAKVGASLENYTVVDGVFTATIGKAGRTFTFVYQPAEETASVTYPRGTCDERGYLAAAHYGRAKEYMANEQYDEAYAEFKSISDYAKYKDVDSLLTNDPDLSAAVVAAREAKLAPYKKAGSYVTFGTYPQTSSGTDSTPIEWLVLDYDAADNRALLISRYGLDAKPYNTEYTNITWEKCTLRTWLNNTFYNKAFSAGEQSAILLTNVDNNDSQGYNGWSTYAGNSTQDRIFLLSYTEANKYFGVQYYSYYSASNSDERMNSRVAPTAYAIAQGAYTSSNYKTANGASAGWWWMRSPGNNQNSAASVLHDGSLSSRDVDLTSGAVRPVLWIDLESDFF